MPQGNERAPFPPTHAPTILLIDDDRAVRESLARVLTAEAFEVVLAASGKDALEILPVRRPDLIIMDLRMAPLTGWDLMLHLRRRRPEVPIFVVTAVPAKSAGGADRLATRFFQKPVDIDALLMAIRRHLSGPNTENHEREK
jgi:two-component system, OmpR family, response regulator MprA